LEGLPLDALTVRPRLLLQLAGDEHRVAPVQGLSHVLRHVTPADDADEGGWAVDPLVTFALAITGGHPELRECRPTGEELQLRVASHATVDFYFRQWH
jgi:hypothetical protein